MGPACPTSAPAWRLTVWRRNSPALSRTRTPRSLYGPLRQGQVTVQVLSIGHEFHMLLSQSSTYRQNFDRWDVGDVQWCSHTESVQESRHEAQSYGNETSGRCYLSSSLGHLLPGDSPWLNGPQVEPGSGASCRGCGVALTSGFCGATITLIVQPSENGSSSAPAGLERTISAFIIFERILEAHQRRLVTSGN